MEIGDAIVQTAFGAVAGGLIAVVKVLWVRSEKCIEEHKAKDARIENMEKIIGACESEKCPARIRLWPRPEPSVLSTVPRAQTPPPATA